MPSISCISMGPFKHCHHKRALAVSLMYNYNESLFLASEASVLGRPIIEMVVQDALPGFLKRWSLHSESQARTESEVFVV